MSSKTWENNMEREVLKFEDFINEEVNVTRYEDGFSRLTERWFFYNPDDDIIYGSDEKPLDGLFSFNPISCTIILNDREQKYDVNNPICLIQYNLDDEKVTVYTEDAIEYLNCLGFKGTDITTVQAGYQLQDLFDSLEDDKYILVYGDKMVASTFDVIEEN